MKNLIELHEALRAAGFSITGLSGNPPDVVITGWEGQPDPLADDFIKTFNWNEPTDSEIKDRLSRLTTEEKQRVLDAALEQLALANPKLLDRAIVTATARVR